MAASLPSPPLTNTTGDSSTIRGGATGGASDLAGSNEAATKLAEAIDDFLGDLEKKFKGISDEILTKLDDMAERCDRLEQEMLLRDATTVDATGKDAGGGSTAGSI